MLTKLFLAILGIGLCSSILIKDITFSQYENRKLQILPNFSINSFFSSTYTSEFDAYANDQFPLRPQWIQIKTSIEKNLLFKNCINNVYLGRNDYLINRYTNKDLDSTRIERNIDYLNNFASQHNVTVLIPPTASEVLIDKLPFGYYHINQSSYLNNIKNRSSATNVLYEHVDENIFFKTDHHWTLLGAYYVYKELVSDPLPYEVSIVSDSFLGTTYRKINYATTTDSLATFQSPHTFSVTYDLSTTTDSLYTESALETLDQYVYYLDGNHAITIIENETIDSSESLLIIKDSFANIFAPLIANHYRTVHMIDLRQYNGSVTKYIEEHKIDQIIFLYNQINFMQDTNLAKL